jgi:streptogramin lyase
MRLVFFKPLFWLVLAFIGCMAFGPAQAQTITEFAMPSGVAGADIAVGQDGALWFSAGQQGTGGSTGLVGRITTAGAITTFPVSVNLNFATLLGIVAGPDGRLWFAEGPIPSNLGRIGAITTSGTLTEYTINSASAEASAITVGPDGNLWFTDLALNRIGKITTAGTITEYATPQTNSSPDGITLGPDGNLWFIENGNTNVTPTSSPKIGRIKPDGTMTEFAGAGWTSTVFFQPGQGIVGPHRIISGPDGALWFTEAGAAKIGRITTAGVITEFALPKSNARPEGIAVGRDGALWFTEFGVGLIGRITTSGTISEFTPPTTGSAPSAIIQGPDNNLWFVETASNKIGKLALADGTSGLVSAVLPASRSTSVGTAATAFATIINSGSSAVSGCTIVPVTSIPATFSFQTTNPSTNAVTGSANAPVSIGAGGSQTFVFAITPQASFVPVNVVLGYSCTNTDAANSAQGLNTILLSGSATAVPDLVALGATSTNDGILHITGTSGSAAFAVATVNVGASATTITAQPNTGSATLSLNLSICQTNPATGLCLQSPTASVSTAINAGATPTFAVFATATGAVPFLPAANRIFLQFTDGSGAVRGATSVAVRTE